MGLFSKSKKDRPSKTNDSKSSKTQNLEVLVSAKEFDDGQNKIGLAERFTIIKRNDSKKTFTVQIESLISQEDIDFLKNKKGEDDLTVKNLVPGWNKISFDVPEDLVLESRKNQTENTKDIFNRIAQNDIEYFKGPEYSNWAKEISIDGKLNAQSIRDGVGIATENVLAKMFVEKMEDEDEDSG
ncbi:MAG: hypothetical protein MHPSP_000071 [Paramarteilia canceri]